MLQKTAEFELFCIVSAFDTVKIRLKPGYKKQLLRALTLMFTDFTEL
jgi:hypothetical protein